MMLVLATGVFSFFLTLVLSVAAAPSACIKPSVRKEWRALEAQEKAAWIKAVNCLSHLPHDPALTATVNRSISLIPPINASSSYYDDYVYVNMDLSTQILFTGLFLPWHRYYVHVLEGALKSKCGYEGASPYWDWTIDAPNFFESKFWKDSDPHSGLGGWGDPNADFSVRDGGFRDLRLSYPSPHNVRRNFTLQPFVDVIPSLTEFIEDPLLLANTSITAAAVEKVLDTPAPGDFKGFQKALETFQGVHSSVHVIMGADMGGTCPRNAPKTCTPSPAWPPNDPVFFLHHGMIDKIWYEWQQRNPKNAKSFFGGSVAALQSVDAYNQYPNGGPPFLNLNSTMTMDGLFPDATIGDVMDTTGGFLCYVYE